MSIAPLTSHALSRAELLSNAHEMNKPPKHTIPVPFKLHQSHKPSIRSYQDKPFTSFGVQGPYAVRFAPSHRDLLASGDRSLPGPSDVVHRTDGGLSTVLRFSKGPAYSIPKAKPPHLPNSSSTTPFFDPKSAVARNPEAAPIEDVRSLIASAIASPGPGGYNIKSTLGQAPSVRFPPRSAPSKLQPVARSR